MGGGADGTGMELSENMYERIRREYVSFLFFLQHPHQRHILPKHACEHMHI